MDPARPLRDETFRQFATVIHEAIGVRIGPDRRATFEAHLRTRLHELHLADFEQYLSAVRDGGSPDEMEELCDAVLDTSSTPLRDDAEGPGAAAASDFLFHWVEEFAASQTDAFSTAPPGRALRCWSAGGGDGGEACELLALSLQAARRLPISVLGTDIHAGAIARARRHAADPRLRFERHNLIGAAPVGKGPEFGPFDVVLLRAVLPEFDARTRARVLAMVHQSLRPSGVLILGGGESLLNIEHPFRLRQPSVFVRTAMNPTSSANS